MLRGRHNERDVLNRQLQRVRAGESSVLVVRGEAGVGKTALLEYVAERASWCRIVRVAGVESEMELAFAGLHQLCAPMLDGLDGLPGPQRDALRVAFGLQDGAASNRFLVALAILSLLAEAAETQPLVCLVDDAQWLDRASAQALAFVARRLLAERIAVVFAVREPSDVDELTGLPELVVGGLADDDARWLLASALPGRLDEHVRDQIVAETRGNPLALLELPRGLTPAELAGGFGLPDARPLASRIEETFVQRVRALPRETQRLLLVAAAEPVGDVSLLWRAADQLGIRGSAGRPAEEAALIDLGIRVRFRHPLARSAAYRAAHLSDRQEVHRALAEATDPDTDPDRRAWHRAQAASGPDEAVAAELERSADRAQRRGGVAAAAAFLERAAELTPDPARRGARALAAAQAKLEAGSRESRAGAGRDRGSHPARRASARGTAAATRADRVRVHSRQRRSAAPSRCRQTARSARSRVGASDIPRGPRSGYVRRTRQCRLRCAGGGRGGPSRARGAAAAAIDRSRSRRPGAPVHGGAQRGCAGAQARTPGGQERGSRWSRGDHALALADSDRPVDDCVRVVGRRRVPRARHPRRAAGSRYRRARPAPRRTRLQVRRAPVRRGTRGGRGPCRGGGRDCGRDRQRKPAVRLAPHRRVARRRSRSHEVHQRRSREHNGAIRGQGGGSGRLCQRRSQQRLGSLPGGNGRREAR